MSLEERSKRQIRRKLRNPPKPKRRLRVYALDPSIGKRLASIAVNETVLQVEWEEGLKPGPVGEYLEVVDVDPATNKVYEPVDLNEPKLLAQDGWHPSEGNPQFHQQMVYAVAMSARRYESGRDVGLAEVHGGLTVSHPKEGEHSQSSTTP
jgi:hypothetical protein